MVDVELDTLRSGGVKNCTTVSGFGGSIFALLIRETITFDDDYANRPSLVDSKTDEREINFHQVDPLFALPKLINMNERALG